MSDTQGLPDEIAWAAKPPSGIGIAASAALWAVRVSGYHVIVHTGSVARGLFVFHKLSTVRGLLQPS